MNFFKMTDMATGEILHINHDQLADIALKLNGNKITEEVVSSALYWQKRIVEGEVVDFDYGQFKMRLERETNEEIIKRLIAELPDAQET